MLAKKLSCALMLAATLTNAGCAAATESQAMPAPAPAAATETRDGTGTAYSLGPGDKLRITVFGEDNLSGEYAVSSTGMISFPLVGNIEAAGKSLTDVQEMLRSRLASGYINDPRVAVEVLEYRTFYILGEVNKPGEYPYRANMTVEQAVATAGGFTYRANRKRFEIARSGTDNESARVKFDEARGLKVAPGDTIQILERFF